MMKFGYLTFSGHNKELLDSGFKCKWVSIFDNFCEHLIWSIFIGRFDNLY